PESDASLRTDEVQLKTHSDHLDRVYADTETRQKETKELLVSLALYLNGEKLGLSLAAQRTYLRNVFDGYSRDEHGLAQRRRLVKSMADMAEFRHNYWDPTRVKALDAFHHSPRLSDELKLCFSFLKAIGTSLTLPILARYWVAWRSGDLPEAELLEAAKAIAAYVVLRRSVTGGTAGIDSEFRRLMHPNPATGGGPFCAGVNRPNGLPTAAILKTELRDRYLKKPCDTQDRQAWVAAAANVPLARSSRPLCRLLLLAAAHNALPDPATPGLLTKQSVRRSENLDYLSFRRWDSPLYATVEHVAPDSTTNAAWDAAIYRDEFRHTLGNLILLPHRENAKIGNAEWSKKKLFYRALTAKTQDDKDAVLQQARKQGLDFGKKTRELFADSEQLVILESLDAVAIWDREFIQFRGQRLLELAWDEIWSWLAPD
ncbi:MAG: HNH endonuclease family protein, partial [Gammaproteobacteria bacterium]|nr:HNH endonuclease family protein [Gammaproteobacteria bacterium]